MEDYLIKGYQKGRVKDVSEAFKDYPVEEEIHQGYAEYYVAEKIIKYGSYEIGDIVFINKYKYENGSMGKDHLFVIIDKNNKSVPLNYFGLILSSNLKKLKYKSNAYLKKNTKNNLTKDSIVKCDYIYIISNKDIAGKIGEIDLKVIEKYKRIYNSLLNDEVTL